MIWFFLMGMIGGAAGVILFEYNWIRRHMRRVGKEEFLKDIQDMEDSETQENPETGILRSENTEGEKAHE